ncbi:MAG: hypothetical protein PHW07_07080 [Sulfurospirillaceae bacterium]|nr:hypothetical protein [Sulfurospirillaceae bacterium]
MKKIAIFAHDAGGAEILLELLKASLHVGEFCVFCLNDSPCFRLAETKNLEAYVCKIEPTKEDIKAKLFFFNPDIILYGTGWQNHLEYHFLEYAKEYKLPSFAFLDHWTNYRERFGYPNPNWQNNLPSYIVAHDKTSEQKAKELGLPNVIAIKNYALLAQLKAFKKTKEDDTLLFLSEPTAKVALASFKDANFWGFNEKKVFEDILTCKDIFGCGKIIIRLHPSDSRETYEAIDNTVEFSKATLLEDIAKAKLIIGIDTIALYTAYLLGKKVISYIPSNKRECAVPLPKSNQLKSFENFDISSLQTLNENPQDFGMDFEEFLNHRCI